MSKLPLKSQRLSIDKNQLHSQLLRCDFYERNEETSDEDFVEPVYHPIVIK